MSSFTELATIELWYEPMEPGSQMPILHDPKQHIPVSQLKSWQRELDAKVEQLRQDNVQEIQFLTAVGAWPTIWNLEDHTEPRSRIPRMRLTAELRSPSSTPVSPPPAAPTSDWIDHWLREARAAMCLPASDHVAEACLVYAMHELRAQATQDVALTLLKSHLILAIWNAQQTVDTDQCHLGHPHPSNTS